MNGKRIRVHIAPGSAQLLNLIAGNHGEHEIKFSSAVNLVTQFAKLLIQEKLPLQPNELLFCCDVLNPGGALVDFETPDSVSIGNALESALFGLVDAVRGNYGSELEKWDCNPSAFLETLKSLNTGQLFTLIIATRHFWGKGELEGFKSAEELGYVEWAGQWCENR